MGKQTVNLNSELHVIAANLDIIKSIWEELFGKYAIRYDRAKTIVEEKISDAGSGLKNTMMTAVADLVLTSSRGFWNLYLVISPASRSPAWKGSVCFNRKPEMPRH